VTHFVNLVGGMYQLYCLKMTFQWVKHAAVPYTVSTVVT